MLRLNLHARLGRQQFGLVCQGRADLMSGIAARIWEAAARRAILGPEPAPIEARDALAELLGKRIGVGPREQVLVEGPRMRCISSRVAGGDRSHAWCVAPRSSGDNCAMIKGGWASRCTRVQPSGVSSPVARAQRKNSGCTAMEPPVMPCLSSCESGSRCLNPSVATPPPRCGKARHACIPIFPDLGRDGMRQGGGRPACYTSCGI